MYFKLPAEPTLVGRDQEIKQLLQHYDSASNGKGTSVFICGEAGVGKTRLINGFLDLARKKETKILAGWCLSEAAIPYFPFREAFDTFMSSLSDEKTKSAVKKQLGITGWLKGPELAQEPRARELFLTLASERDATFEAVATFLLQLSKQEPLILFLDDLQWADQLSLALLHYLSRKCRNSRLLIIGTYRPEDIISAKEEKLHPLEETMFSMGREDLLVKMILNPLKRNDFPELLTSILHSTVDEEFVNKLYEETDGNPLFTLETLNLLVDEGFLSDRQGRWTLTAPTEKIRIPSKVAEVINRRISRLRREERKLLDLAAVCGFSFTPTILSGTLGSDIADVLQTLVEIEQRHRLIRSTDSTFQFTHHKIREVINANMPTELKKVYHLKTASCLESALTEKVSDAYIADIALHYVEGGAPEKAFGHFVELGEKAANTYANMQAIEYLDRALETTKISGSLATSENLARIYKLRGRAQLAQGETTKAISDFNQLLKNVTSIGNESMILEARYLLGSAHIWAGSGDEAVLHLTTAIEMARRTGNKIIESRSLGQLAGPLLHDTETMEQGLIKLQESIKICKETCDKVLEAHDMLLLGVHYYWEGEFNKAKEKLNRAVSLTEELGDKFYRLFSLLALSWVLGSEGEYNHAMTVIQEGLHLSQDGGLVFFIPRFLNTLGWIHNSLLNIELALKYNSEGLEVARTHQEIIGVGAVQPACLVNLGDDYFQKNDYDNAEKYFKEASDTIHLHPLVKWRFENRILLGLGQLSLVKGDYAQAQRFAEDALAMAEKSGAKKNIAKSLKLKAEVMAKTGSIEEAIELMQSALKLAQEVGNPPLLWQINYSLGLLLEKHGNPQKAHEHHAEAIAFIEETASKLKDESLKNILLTAPQSKAIQDAYAKTKPTSQRSEIK